MHANGPHKISLSYLLVDNFSDQINFDAGAKRNLRRAKGRAHMTALIAKDFPQQLRSAVSHQMLLREFRGAVNEHHQLRNVADTV